MYTFHKRTAPHPNLVSFDCPDANATLVQRAVSDTPIQALTTLNNECFHEAAQALARRTLADGGADDESRVTYALRLCVARAPDSTESAELRNLLSTAKSYYAAHADEAKKLIGKTIIAGTKPEETAAWVATVRIVLNLDEFITRE
jgi:hypothetical protein